MEDLKKTVREFFSYLDYVAETDSGKEFHPITITCCRVLMQEPLSDCLTKMKELSKED